MTTITRSTNAAVIREHSMSDRRPYPSQGPTGHAALGARLCVALTLYAVSTQPLQAKPGDLDSSFGRNGHTWYTFSPQELAAREGPVARGAGIVQQADGKLVVGLSLGQILSEGIYVIFDSQVQDLVVERFNGDGSPDLTFNSVGRTGPDFPGIAATTYSVLLQADGKIVAAGEGSVLGPAAGAGRIALARYYPDGSPDSAFANGGAGVFDTGWQITQLPYVSAPVYVLEQADGRLVVGATALSVSTHSPPWPGRMALARFTTSGALDATFGTNGSVVLASSRAGSDDNVSGIGQQSDGKLIAAGTTGSSAGRDFVVVRLTAAGALDPNFGVGGRVIVSFGAGTAALSSGDVAIEPDGKILLVGTIGSTSLQHIQCSADADAAVIRLNSDGSLDAAFGNGGKVRFGVSTCDAAESIALAPDGSMYIGGVAGVLRGNNMSWLQDAYVARLTSSGRIDPRYGNDGISIIDLGTDTLSSYATDVHLIRQADGRIVVVADSEAVQQTITRLLETGSYPGVLGFTSALQDADTTTDTVSIAVRRTGGSSGAVSVDYATNGSLGIGGTLSWADGDPADKNIVIAIPAGMGSGGPETFELRLTNPSGGASVSDGEMEVQVLSRASTSAVSGSTGGGGALGSELLVLLALALCLLTRTRIRFAPSRSVQSGPTPTAVNGGNNLYLGVSHAKKIDFGSTSQRRNRDNNALLRSKGAGHAGCHQRSCA
jgi:uncharacterized delta-60 repeat protein